MTANLLVPAWTGFSGWQWNSYRLQVLVRVILHFSCQELQTLRSIMRKSVTVRLSRLQKLNVAG